MQHDEFIGTVQNWLDLDSRGDAETATRAVLTTLGERLQAGEAADLAAPLPQELGHHLETAESGQRFDAQEFLDRVAERENVERATAAFHTQAIIDILHDTVPRGEMDDIRANLPDDYDELFQIADQAEPPVPEEQQEHPEEPDMWRQRRRDQRGILEWIRDAVTG